MGVRLSSVAHSILNLRDEVKAHKASYDNNNRLNTLVLHLNANYRGATVDLDIAINERNAFKTAAYTAEQQAHAAEQQVNTLRRHNSELRANNESYQRDAREFSPAFDYSGRADSPSGRADSPTGRADSDAKMDGADLPAIPPTRAKFIKMDDCSTAFDYSNRHQRTNGPFVESKTADTTTLEIWFKAVHGFCVATDLILDDALFSWLLIGTDPATKTKVEVLLFTEDARRTAASIDAMRPSEMMALVSLSMPQRLHQGGAHALNRCPGVLAHGEGHNGHGQRCFAQIRSRLPPVRIHGCQPRRPHPAGSVQSQPCA